MTQWEIEITLMPVGVGDRDEGLSWVTVKHPQPEAWVRRASNQGWFEAQRYGDIDDQNHRQQFVPWWRVAYIEAKALDEGV